MSTGGVTVHTNYVHYNLEPRKPYLKGLDIVSLATPISAEEGKGLVTRHKASCSEGI